MTIPLGNSLRMQWNLQVQSLIFLSWVFLSTEKAYSSFPRLKNLELFLFINTLLLHCINPRPSLYNISAKNHQNCLKNPGSKAYLPFLVVAIFLISGFYLTINNYVFDHSNFLNIISPGIRVKTIAKPFDCKSREIWCARFLEMYHKVLSQKCCHLMYSLCLWAVPKQNIGLYCTHGCAT